MNPPRILITGKPGIGKTTVVQKVLKELPVLTGGFYTEEIREKGARVGFRLKTLDGREGILAHVESDSPYRVSKYGVEVKTFEDIAVPALELVLQQFNSRAAGDTHLSAAGCPHPAVIVVMDELGRMELFSKLFQQTVHRILEYPVPVLAVIQDRRNPFLDAIRFRKDVTLIRITDKNRNSVVEEIINNFRNYFQY